MPWSTTSGIEEANRKSPSWTLTHELDSVPVILRDLICLLVGLLVLDTLVVELNLYSIALGYSL
jgi:hypothetical protein